MVGLLHILAEGPKDANIWNPTIIGLLTVVAAVGLFCGSVYLLLGTNLGGRLGFLVAAAGLTGFMLLLTTLWWTSGSSGIDPPHGRSPAVESGRRASEPGRLYGRRPCTTSRRTARRSPSDKLTNIKPAVDAAIVPAASLTGETPAAKKFATLGFAASTEYIADSPDLSSYIIGGGTKNLFWHAPQYAVVEICTRQSRRAPGGVRPAEADALRDPETRPRHAAATGRALLVHLPASCSASRSSVCTGTSRTNERASGPRLTPVPTSGA